ncbi:MAG: hypothetical protein IPK83_20780 [Planctomycetes bacterium]|nr:hypothetical protein [Planctomycetota bacterium]
MASLYKRGDVFWIGYRTGGRTIQRSLHTTNERIARDKKKQFEYELMIGDLQTESRLSTIHRRGVLQALEGPKPAQGPFKRHEPIANRLWTDL